MAILPGVYDWLVRDTLIYQGVIYCVLIILVLYRLILQWFISRTNTAMATLITWWCLSLLLVHAIRE